MRVLKRLLVSFSIPFAIFLALSASIALSETRLYENIPVKLLLCSLYGAMAGVLGLLSMVA